MSYNESGTYFNTSSKQMIEEKEIWEEIVPHSALLIQKLEAKEIDNYFLAKYINVVFGMRCFYDSFVEYNNFINKSKATKRMDNYKFHYFFRNFISNADSVLDYLDKLFKDLKKLNSELDFNRKSDSVEKFSRELSNIRNDSLHEGVPTMYTNTRSYSTSPCHANVAGSSDFDTVIFILIKGKNGQSNDASELIKRYYLKLSTLVNNLTNQMIEEFKNTEDNFNK